MSDTDITPGATFTRHHPFTRMISTYEGYEWEAWRPGAWGTDYTPPDDCQAFAHSLGAVTFTIVAACQLPGRLHDRVFYYQQFTDPDGRKMTRIMKWATLSTRLISVEEAATQLGKSDQRIRQMCSSGKLRSKRLGKRVLVIDKNSVEERKLR